MSLRVWLPLNGDIKNYGASDATMVLSGATVNTNGKIGSCYAFDGSDDCISIDSTTLRSIFKGGANPFSITLWIYHADSTRAILFGDFNLDGAINFNVELSTEHLVRFYWTANPDFHFANSSVSANKWSHVAVTYSGTELCCYINGNLVDTKTYTLDAKNKTSGVFFLGRDSRTGTTALNGRMNDFRVYDHCLSVAEVKEISKALVLHYPLNDYDTIGPNNRMNATNASGWINCYGGSWTRNALVGERGYNYVLNYTGTGTSVWKYLASEKFTFTAGKVYKWSCKVRCHSANMTITMRASRADNDWVTTMVNVVGSSLADGQWHEYTLTQTINSTFDRSGTTVTSNPLIEFYTQEMKTSGTVFSANFDIKDIQIVESDVNIPFKDPSWPTNIVKDASGYNRHGTVTASTSPIITTGSPRNSYCCQFDGGNDYIISSAKQGDILADKKFTISAWVYPTEHRTCRGVFGPHESTNGQALGICFGQCESNGICFTYGTGSGWGTGVTDTNYTLNAWTHYVMTYTYDGSTSKEIVYKNGVKLGEYNYSGSIAFATANNIWIGRTYPDEIRYWKGKLSDLKVYATALSADDVAQEYRAYASIYKDSSFHSSDIKEDPCANLLAKSNDGIARKTWTAGLSSFTQTNCSVSLTNNGYRIYRPAGVAANNSQWGGFVIKQYNENNADLLIKGHTYIIKFHVKGKSSNDPEFYWTNNVGWGGGGLDPYPSNVSYQMTPANFNGEMDCWYKWTINDDVYKVCTSSYSSFVQGQTYLSYRDFKYGFGYAATGDLGTDLYITNVRLYDVTSKKYVNIGLNGVLNGELVEGNYDKAAMFADGEIYSREFITV